VPEGEHAGVTTGAEVGANVGVRVGANVGAAVGAVGAKVGAFVGAAVGAVGGGGGGIVPQMVKPALVPLPLEYLEFNTFVCIRLMKNDKRAPTRAKV
jgi:phage tail tape-measure protein